jgi:hypothetical protein
MEFFFLSFFFFWKVIQPLIPVTTAGLQLNGEVGCFQYFWEHTDNLFDEGKNSD